MKKKHRMRLLRTDVELLFERMANVLDRIEDLEIRIDEATPEFPDPSEPAIKDHIRKSMEESRRENEMINNQLPKWVR